ncbi:acetate--CoA ligase family protein [Gracilinema caldarium]|uniref:acetate--CoA ligase family protein n=1 Tax=Gracilinema caldarium TaxID=215591 RepID=UPI0026EF0052|nr:acetate--CoA ligase family protein [Gracilinema caldarium]
MNLDPQIEQNINKVFAGALAAGRRTLYEYEVYEILKALGLQVPRYLHITDPITLTEDQLGPFLPRAVLKIVSPDIAHKSKLGGVKIIDVEDPLYVRFVMEVMHTEVLSHFSETEKPRIEGFLLAELIPFSQALGNEVLIGVKEDIAFGPTVTLTKGGDDAEFFAKYYDPPNLALAPLSKDEAYAITHNLKIRHKFSPEIQASYCNKMGDALYAISQLAYEYSFSREPKPAFHLLQMDVNPFVFSKTTGHPFVAVDGFAQFMPSEERNISTTWKKRDSLKAFFEPSGIAVAGVSSDATKYNMARIIVGLLTELGREDVYCLNPKGGSTEIAGKTFPLYPTIQDIPVKCSLYVFAAPAQRTVEFLETVPDGSAVILISGIPSEIHFTDFAAIVAQHSQRGLRIIGPNCMGVFFAPDKNRKGVNTLFLGDERLPIRWTEHSNVALFTQSGAMGITAVERAPYWPIYRTIVSFGNKVDVNVPDLVGYFCEEPRISVMAMYLEGLGPGEGRAFFEAAKNSSKPLIVYKAGRTEAGAKAAASHTASMSGDYEIFQAACSQAGIILIDELPDFYNAVKAFSMLDSHRPQGLRVGGVVNAGLDATMGADLLGNLKPAVYTTETNQTLQKLNIHGLLNVGASFLDVTPMTDDRLFADIVDAMLSDPQVDCAFVAIVPHVETLKTTEELCREADALGPLLVKTAVKHKKPLVISVNAGSRYQGLVQVLEEGGIPVYPDIRSAMRALDTFCSYWARNK